MDTQQSVFSFYNSVLKEAISLIFFIMWGKGILFMLMINEEIRHLFFFDWQGGGGEGNVVTRRILTLWLRCWNNLILVSLKTMNNIESSSIRNTLYGPSLNVFLLFSFPSHLWVPPTQKFCGVMWFRWRVSLATVSNWLNSKLCTEKKIRHTFWFSALNCLQVSDNSHSARRKSQAAVSPLYIGKILLVFFLMFLIGTLFTLFLENLPQLVQNLNMSSTIE